MERVRNKLLIILNIESSTKNTINEGRIYKCLKKTYILVF